jgi:hypothetical protein
MTSSTDVRHIHLKGIHLPSVRFSWKLKRLCRVDLFVFESWQTAEDVPCDFTAVCHDSKTKKSTGQSFFNFQENLTEGKMNTFQILTSKFRFDLMHSNVSIGPEKWPIFGRFLKV